mmetsp:Transcript_14370/g.45242  ORF Transcript_14370/g.45242 Transcript_14370/m.45242 type:complete len:203 (+) Transcript_14370:177-785(+)
MRSCRRRMRRAVMNWFSSGRCLEPGILFKTFLRPLGSKRSVWTRMRPVARSSMTSFTTSATRWRPLPRGSWTNAASPLTSSAENSLRVLAPSRPNFATSTPKPARCSCSASSARPTGALTSAETSSVPSALSFTLCSSAALSDIHAKDLVMPSEFTARHVEKSGRPTLASSSTSSVQRSQSTSSFLYTVRTPGYDGDSVSSS